MRLSNLQVLSLFVLAVSSSTLAAQDFTNYISLGSTAFKARAESRAAHICGANSDPEIARKCSSYLTELFTDAQSELKKGVNEDDWESNMEFYADEVETTCEARYSGTRVQECRFKSRAFLNALRDHALELAEKRVAVVPEPLTASKPSVVFGTLAETPRGLRRASETRPSRGTSNGTSLLDKWTGIGAPPPGFSTQIPRSYPESNTKVDSKSTKTPNAGTAKQVGKQLSVSCINVIHNGLGTNTYSATLTNNCGQRVRVWGGIMFNGQPVEWTWVAANFADGQQPRLTMDANQTTTMPSAAMRWPGSFGWQVMGVRSAD